MTMQHWILITIAVTAIGTVAYMALGVARHVSHRITIKLDSGYGWKDAGVLLRRKTRQEFTGEPGRHRAEEQQPPPASVAAIMAGDDEEPLPPAMVFTPGQEPEDPVTFMLPVATSTMVTADGAEVPVPAPASERELDEYARSWAERHGGPDEPAADKKPGE